MTGFYTPASSADDTAPLDAGPDLLAAITSVADRIAEQTAQFNATVIVFNEPEPPQEP